VAIANGPTSFACAISFAILAAQSFERAIAQKKKDLRSANSYRSTAAAVPHTCERAAKHQKKLVPATESNSRHRVLEARVLPLN